MTWRILFSMGLILVELVYGQTVAEISYISKQGMVKLASDSTQALYRGKGLGRVDELVLEKGAQVRLFFPGSGKSKKYLSPTRVYIGAEAALQEQSKIATADDELTNWLQQNTKPNFSNHGGRRSSASTSSSSAVFHLKSYLTNPHLVLQSDDRPHRLFIKKTLDGNAFMDFLIPPARDARSFLLSEKKLEHGRSYYWNMDGSSPTNILQIVSRQEAMSITNRLKQLRDEAIDLIEFYERAAAFLAKSGFLAEAFYYVEKGLATDQSNAALVYLKNNILLSVPALSAPQAVSLHDDIILQYSFHCRKGDEFKEIRDHSVLHSGDEMQIRLLASQDCYVFIINLNTMGGVNVLFPALGRDHFIAADKMSIIPSEFEYFRADSSAGKERLFLIASRMPLDYFARQLDQYFNQSPGIHAPFDVYANLGDGENHRIADATMDRLRPGAFESADVRLTRILQGAGRIIREIAFYHER